MQSILLNTDWHLPMQIKALHGQVEKGHSLVSRQVQFFHSSPEPSAWYVVSGSPAKSGLFESGVMMTCDTLDGSPDKNVKIEASPYVPIPGVTIEGRDRELNPGLGIHSPTGYRYPTPAIRECEMAVII